MGACSDLLNVDNPGAIRADQLNDPLLGQKLTHSVVGGYQAVADNLAYYSAVLTDEAVTGHNFETIKEIDLRLARANNGTVANDIYEPLQAARFLGDSISGRLRVIFGDSASRSLSLARTLAYAGYANMLLGEFMCKAPVDPTGASLTWDDFMARALERYQEAITIADAFEAAGGRTSSADTVRNIARVGAGRAALNVGDMATAIGYASAVDADFSAWVPHDINHTLTFYGATHGANRNLGVAVTFRFLNDTRVKHESKSVHGHNGLTDLWTPYQGESFSGWIAGDSTEFLRETGMRFASGLEARYIVAEAQGATQATVDFINERRKVGDPAATDITLADDVMAALRDERRRDFYLDGHRLGDLRRYIKLYDIDKFPSGPHPNVSWGNYGTNECFLLPEEETTGNPNA
jgi:hypothetical protein